MMPSVVQPNPGVSDERSARPGAAGKPTTSDVPRKRSQVLVSSESSRRVRSGDCSGPSTSRSSSVSNQLSKLADRALKQKVDLPKHGAAAASTGVAATRVVSTRNPALRATRVKPPSSECSKPGTNGRTEKGNVLKTTGAPGAVARLSIAKTGVQQKSLVETGRREDVAVSTVKRRPTTVTASVTSCVKHEASSRQSSRMVATSQTKTAATVSSLAIAKKPPVKRGNGTSLTTGQTSGKRDKGLCLAVEQSKKKCTSAVNNDKCSLSLSRNKATELISDEGVDISISQDQSLPAVNSNGSRCNVCISEDHQSNLTSESPLCESVRSSTSHSEHVLKPTCDIAPVYTCTDENGSDLEETNVCDISMHSCRSDGSTSLFHSACSSIVGSISDMKLLPLNHVSLDNGDLGMLSASNSVSVDSLHSSAGYCTPSEPDNACEVADCTISNMDDSRYVFFCCQHFFMLGHISIQQLPCVLSIFAKF